MRSITTIAIAAALSGSVLAGSMLAGPALAGERHRGWQEAATAPMSIDEVARTGSGTVVGTILSMDDEDFVLSDGAGRIDVDNKARSAAGLQPGDTVTVIGRMDGNGFEARQIIRTDGSVLARHRQR